MGLEAATVHVDGVEFEAETISTVPTWLTRSVQIEVLLSSLLMLNDAGLKDCQVLLDRYWFFDL